MPPASKPALAPVVLIHGEDDFTVKQRARAAYDAACAGTGGLDNEIIDASANNSSEALKALGRLRGALQTLPFFGTGKVVWFRDCNFLSDERTAAAQAVTESLASLAQEFKEFRWDNVRLIISAARVDKRRILYKTLEKIGTVEAHAGLSAESKDWVEQAERLAREAFEVRRQRITEEALGVLVAAVGPNLRQLYSEIEKVSVSVGTRSEIEAHDVTAVAVRNKQAHAFALAEALGDRHLPRVLRALDEEAWEIRMKVDRDKSYIGLLYGLIARVRTLLLLKECFRARWLRPETDYARFKAGLERIPAGALPEDRRYNLALQHPYVLFKAVRQAANYETEELVRAMELLLACNVRLVSSGLDEVLVLQQTLVQIVGGTPRGHAPASDDRRREPRAARARE